jgi:hypothetical protein
MYSTAALILANEHIRDLVADAHRERLADLARRERKPRAAGRSWRERLLRFTTHHEPNPGRCVPSPG